MGLATPIGQGGKKTFGESFWAMIHVRILAAPIFAYSVFLLGWLNLVLSRSFFIGTSSCGFHQQTSSN